MQPELTIILTSITDDLASAWRSVCGDLPRVEVHHGDIFKTAPDAVVSPANSFGFMDGGIDAVYTRVFGPGVQERLQRRIRERHFGELLVGAADIVETEHAEIPYVIAAPTMRVPMRLPDDTVNPYLAARAALILIAAGRLDDGTPVRERVKRVAFPGLATGVGRVPAEICAKQVRAAIEDITLGQRRFPDTWKDAQTRHQQLFREQTWDLQRD
ncbi:MAG: macro domain-containing protein [Myxococcales bacterium]|nr:macro domain-containing protein [Myxococcales bacterium]